MGVPGLTTFIDQNPQLLSDTKLHNTKIIIDGNNLYHFLYYYFRVSIQHGGDYDVYAQKVRYFFQTLHTCRITAYVVFDGGYDANDKKLKTTLKRAKERIHLANFLSHGQRAKILPLLCYETFRLVLEEIGIPHVSCDFEADDQIAALANIWECPVLTNDSDFFIYNLKAGTILLDYLNLDIKTDGHDPEVKYLEVQMYHIENFVQKFKNLDMRMFPLFATLMGNDYVDTRQLEPFFQAVQLPKASSKRFFSPERHKRITSLLLWLESVHDFEHAFDKILSHFKEDKRESVKSNLEKSVNTYLKLDTSLHLYFEGEDVKCRNRSRLRTFDGHPLPYWFVERVRRGDLAPILLDAIVLHRVILLSQVETMSEASAYNTSLPVREVIYGILTSLDRELAKTEAKKQANMAAHVTEYNREQKNLKKFDILPKFDISDMQVPYLQKIPHLSEREREEVLLKAAGLHSPPSGAPHMQLLTLTMEYWCMNAVPRITELHLIAILTSILKLSLVDAAMSCDTHLPERDIGEYKCGQKNAQRACDNLARFLLPRSGLFDSAAMHALSQFQGCLRDLMCLNQLLQCPYPSPNPARVYSGTLMYNLYKELEARANPALFVQELLGRGSPAAAAFTALLDAIVSRLPEGCLTQHKGHGSKNKKKRDRKKLGRKECVRECESVDREDADDEQSGKVVTACEVNNRFAGLVLEE